MKTGQLAIYGIIGGALLFAGSASADEPQQLTSTQQKYLQQQIETQLKDPGQRKMVAEWPESKQVAEFLCRPLAHDAVRKLQADADRIFLGEGNDGTFLTLESSSRLTGKGQYRTGMDWHVFQFECLLSEQGAATAFHVLSEGEMPTKVDTGTVGQATVQ